jgi:hypothetical protein
VKEAQKSVVWCGRMCKNLLWVVEEWAKIFSGSWENVVWWTCCCSSCRKQNWSRAEQEVKSSLGFERFVSGGSDDLGLGRRSWGGGGG